MRNINQSLRGTKQSHGKTRGIATSAFGGLAMTSLLFYLLFFLGISGLIWAAEVHVSALLDPSEASLEDEITLTVTVDGTQQASEPLLPSMPAFKVVSSGTASNIQIINGRLNSSKEYSYILIPQNEGTFTIDPITVSFGGKEYKTEPLQVVISRSGNIHKPQGINPISPFPGGIPLPQQPTIPILPPESRDAWITAEVSNKNPYVNEQILYTFRFYTRARVNEATLTLPDFREFLSEEVVPEKKYYQEIGGDRFVVSEKVMALFPVRAGKTEISETTLQVQMLDSSSNPFFNDPFFNFGRGKTRSKNLRGEKIPMEVKPLPEGAPPHFTNLVGQFSMTADLPVQSLKVGDTATLTITFSGTGNIKDAALPNDLIDLPSFKVYTDKPAADTVKSENGIQGKKVFKVALVPTTAGDFSIPELNFSTFDPRREEYQVLKSSSFTLHVEPAGQETLNTVIGGKAPPAKAGTPLIAEDIATIHTTSAVLEKESWGRGQKFLLLMGYLLPFLFFVVVALTQSRSRYWKQNEKLFRARQAHKKFKKGMNRLKPAKIESAIFVSRLLDLLRDFMGDRFGVYNKGLTAADIVTLLEAHDVDRNLVSEIGELVSKLEAGRYGGGVGIGNPEEGKLRTLRLISAIDRQAWKKLLFVFFLLGSLFLAPPSVTAEVPAEILSRANEAYYQNHLDEAAQGYQKLLDSFVVNGHLYYNLGNVAYREGHRGQAILEYRQALRLIPRDPDVRANLEFVRRTLVDKFEPSWMTSFFSLFFFWNSYVTLTELEVVLAFVLGATWLLGGFLWFSSKRWTWVLFMIFLISSLIFSASTLVKWDGERRSWGIILKPEVEVHPTFLETEKVIFKLHEGTEAEIVGEQRFQEGEDWLQIRLPHGETGWVRGEEMGKI